MEPSTRAMFNLREWIHPRELRPSLVGIVYCWQTKMLSKIGFFTFWRRGIGGPSGSLRLEPLQHIQWIDIQRKLHAGWRADAGQDGPQ